MTPTRATLASAPLGERLSRGAERLLRWAGDTRAALLLLLLTGVANALAALLPDGATLLEGWPYAALLGALALSGLAAVAVRAPSAWREWRRPGPVTASDALAGSLPARRPDEVADALRQAGYRTRLERRGGAWAIHGVRRGWSRFAGLVSHAAVMIIVLGVAAGAAFGSETAFSLLPGEQALLADPRPGFSAAVRLEAFDAEFGADGRPQRLDTRVTFLRDGQEVRTALLRANEPAEFDGHLVHPWTYGPAVRLRVTTLGGAPLLDDAIPLDGERDGVPVGSAELPTAGVTLGLALVDAGAANLLGVSAVGADGLVEVSRIGVGESARVGNLIVEVRGFDAWVTFLSRRDPGLLVLFSGAGLLVASLAVGFWLPRRRVTVRPTAGGDALGIHLRGERFDRPSDELARLRTVLGR